MEISEFSPIKCQIQTFLQHFKLIICLHLYIDVGFLIQYSKEQSNDFIVTFLNITSVLMILFSGLMIRNIHKTWSSLGFLRFSIEYINLALIALTCINKQNNPDEKDEILSFGQFIYIYFKCIFLNISFGMVPKKSILCYILEGLVLMIYGGDKEIPFYHRFWINFFSFRLIQFIVFALLFAVFEFNYTEYLKKILGDLTYFKISYFTVNEIFDNLPLPVIVLTRSGYNVYYTNLQGKEFIAKNSIKKEESELKKSGKTLKTLVNIHFLEFQISRCISLKTNCFDFPLAPLNEFTKLKPKLLSSILFEGNISKLNWVKVYITFCHWDKKEYIILEIFSHPHFSNASEIEFLKTINEQFEKICNNLDSICQNAPPPDTIKNINLCSSSPAFTTMRQSPVPTVAKLAESPIVKSRVQSNVGLGEGKNNPLIDIIGMKEENKNEKFSYLNKISGKRPRKNSITKEDSMLRMEGSKSPILTSKGMKKNEVNYSFRELDQRSLNYIRAFFEIDNIYATHFDPALLYYTKNDLNILLDMYLGLEVFHSFKNEKYLDDLHLISMENFLSYFFGYLKPIALSKGFQIVYTLNDLFKEKVEMHYIYFRAMLFNIVMFIIQNAGEPNEEKTLKVSIDSSSYGQKLVYYKIIVSFIDNNSVINYEKINSSMQFLKTNEVIDLDNKKMRSVNFSLLISYYICKNIFAETGLNNALSLEQNLNNARAVVTYFSVSNTPKKETKEIEFPNLFCELSNASDDTIVTTLTGQEKKKTKMIKSEVYDFGQTDAFILKDEQTVEVKKDKNKAENIKKSISSFQNVVTEKAILPKSKKKLKVVQKKDKYPTETFPFQTMESEIDFCEIPNFLIVEDAIVDKNEIVDELKKMNFTFWVALAGNGEEALSKFNSLLKNNYIYDFIFMDINLPVMSGIEATKIMRKAEKKYKNAHTNIISVTGERRAFEKGLFDKNCKLIF